MAWESALGSRSLITRLPQAGQYVGSRAIEKRA